MLDQMVIFIEMRGDLPTCTSGSAETEQPNRIDGRRQYPSNLQPHAGKQHLGRCVPICQEFWKGVLNQYAQGVGACGREINQQLNGRHHSEDRGNPQAQHKDRADGEAQKGGFGEKPRE